MAEPSSSTARTVAPLPPGPGGLPLVGNTLPFLRDPFAFFDRLAPHGDVVRYRIAGQRFVTLLHPDHVERVLLSQPDAFAKWTAQEFGVEFAPEGVLLTEGSQWRRQRTAIQGAFTLERVESYTDAMVEYADRTVASWDDGETVELDREFSRLALRILARSLFDLDVGQDEGVVRRAADALNERADSRSIQAFFPQWVPTPLNRRFDRAMSDFETLVDGLIDEREGRAAEYDDLLALLLSADVDGERAMSVEEVRDNMITFLFAGHDTTSLALTYTFLLLATHPQKRAKLDDEHESVLGGDPPSMADLDELVYTEKVIRESLRLFPPAYILFRQAAEDVEIGGYRIPEGTKITLPQFRLHADPRFWDDPDAFEPERWSDRGEADVPDYAYFPFGGGPRHCIGMRFAMMELKHVLPTVAQRVEFDLLSDPDPATSPTVTLRPAEPIEARVRRRSTSD